MRALKDKLKEWNKTTQGNLALQKQSILNQLAKQEAIHEHRALNEEEIYSKTALLVEFEEIAKKEEVAWRQRSRALWLKEGAKNTKFFHKTANSHRRFNNIDELNVDGQTIKNPEGIKKEIVEFYQKLYSETESWRPTCGIRDGLRITEEENHMLQKEFENQEILNYVKLCAGDKASGPDRYTMDFFVHCWEVVGEEVIAAVKNFHDRCFFKKSLVPLMWL
ncbi:uncharacterized protein LOC132630744 [Lycium barbarum]|uniref:uncharacterized protein LOC132630744 n=1 Tax=Lycium barbarum TaxID=112863 RepID=UPI00293F1906|nr:uncharacterized protein LOC132630744 [Lycium barbarum]